MRILFISRWFPYPPDNGSKIRVFNLIKHLSVRHEIDLVSFASETISDERLSHLHQYCRHVSVTRYRPFQPYRLRALLGFFSQRPRSVIDTYNDEMQRLTQQIWHGRSFDVVIASELDAALYVTALKGTPKVLEGLELTALYEQFVKQPHPLKKLRSGLTWWKLSRHVVDLLGVFDGCTVVSEQERERLLQVFPGYRGGRVVPNGVDVAQYVSDFGPPEADTLVYPGALTFYANFDAVDYFLREVFPLIQAKRPRARLFVTGGLDGVSLDRLPDNGGVTYTGYLDDVRPRVARSWVTVVPVRLGGGTRLKILEAMALGSPVVATSKGAEGLDLVPGRDLLIADEPAEFAAAVIRLLQDQALRETVGRSGRLAVQSTYDWQVIGQNFCDFVEEIALQGQHT